MVNTLTWNPRNIMENHLKNSRTNSKTANLRENCDFFSPAPENILEFVVDHISNFMKTRGEAYNTAYCSQPVCSPMSIGFFK